MGLKIRPSTSIERKLLFQETLLNTTDAISKVSPHSAVGGISGGIAKVAGKAEKDITLAISQLFPDSAFGDGLDQAAKNFGIAPRFGTSGSSTYVRVTASPGTQYIANTHYPSSISGIRFEFEQDFTVGALGFAYAAVHSIDVGAVTKVDPLTISKLSPAPSGHLNIVNEVRADGGRDVESDDSLRARIKQGANILARGTLAMLEQVFIKINNKVLKIFHHGTNDQGKVVISIVTQSGEALSSSELNDLLVQSATYFNLTEYKPFGTSFYGVALQNLVFQPVDIAFRADLDSSYNPDDIRIKIQTNIAKYLDFRYFDVSTQKVEWDNLLEIVKAVPGVKYVPDQYFYPRTDLTIDSTRLPRLRGFLMLNLEGQVISNFTGTLSPVYYPNVVDASYMATILSEL